MRQYCGKRNDTPQYTRYIGYLAPGGEGIAVYGLYKYVPPWRVWFSSSLLWDGVLYKSESLGLELGIIFQETDQLFKDFSLDKGNRKLPLNNIKIFKSVLF